MYASYVVVVLNHHDSNIKAHDLNHTGNYIIVLIADYKYLVETFNLVVDDVV
jgi:hypothetical protein